MHPSSDSSHRFTGGVNNTNGGTFRIRAGVRVRSDHTLRGSGLDSEWNSNVMICSMFEHSLRSEIEVLNNINITGTYIHTYTFIRSVILSAPGDNILKSD